MTIVLHFISPLIQDFVPEVLLEDAESGEGSNMGQPGVRGHHAYGTMDSGLPGNEHISYPPPPESESSGPEYDD